MIVEDLDLPMVMTMLLQQRCRKEHINGCEYYGAVTPQIRQAGNRLSGLPETNYCANLLA